MAEVEVQEFEVGAHFGNLLSYVAEWYANGVEAICEFVQNALDKKASNVYIKVDCVEGSLVVFDNGEGAGPEEIRAKFRRLATSFKQQGDFGHKGVGNISGVAVGESWQLVTRDMHAKGDPFRVYTFERAQLAKEKDLKLQCETVVFKGINGAPFRANAVQKSRGVNEIFLKQMLDFDTVEQALRDRFNTALGSGKVKVQVVYRDFKSRFFQHEVKPTQYRGVAIEPETYETEYGPVEFRFFHAVNRVEKPKLVVSHQGAYTIPISNFFGLRILPKEIEHLLLNGYFEGEVRLGFCTQNTTHSAFVVNHELQVFIHTIQAFAEDVLKPLVEQLEREDREERLRRVLDSVLRRFKGYFVRYPHNTPEDLKSIRIRLGLAGADASRLAGTQTVRIKDPVDKQSAVSAQPSAPAPSATPGVVPQAKPTKRPLDKDAFRRQREESEQAKRKNEKPERKRIVLKANDGLSVQLVEPDAAAGEAFNWRSRTTPEGVIQINVVSGEFLEAERRGQMELARFMLLLIPKELTCGALPPHEAAAWSRGFENTFLPLWRASLQG